MLSIVVPIFNEEESVKMFYDELIKVTPSLDKDIEIIFVDDGSTDSSLEIIKELAKKNKAIRTFSFRRNLGKSDALSLGFQKARGDYIITLDADLQDKPDQIKKLLDKALLGYDLVSGWRKHRKDAYKHVISSRLFNFLATKLWGLSLHDYNCGLKVYTKDAAKSINVYGSLHRFIPLLVYQKGFRVCEVEVDHEKRKYGKSKYGFSKLWKDFPDIFTMIFLSKYTRQPLHFFGTIGGGMVFLGLVFFIYLQIVHVAGEPIASRPLFFISLILIVSGLQVFFTGFLADLLINVTNQKERTFLLKYSSES